MPSKRNNKRNNKNKQKAIVESYVEPIVHIESIVHVEPYYDREDCVKRGFTVISNNGVVSEKREHYTSSCFFKSISDYLGLTANKMSAIKIRNCIKFPKKSIEVDTVTHANYIQAICNLFKISIAFFTVNTDDIQNNYACWIGNPCVVFTAIGHGLPIQRVSIASYGAHYELIVSETPFSPDLRNRCKHFNIKIHEFHYGHDRLVYTNGGETEVRSYRDVVQMNKFELTSHVELERQLIDAQLNYIQQESMAEIFKRELIKLTCAKVSVSGECRTRYLQKMIELSSQCCAEISDNIVAIQLQSI